MGTEKQYAGSTSKEWEDLDITDDFIFKTVMKDEGICKGLLERVLPELKISKVRHPVSENSMRQGVDSHGVRLDVYVEAEDGETIYDIEMQASNKGDLVMRARYYASEMDIDFLKPGKLYLDLPDSYVIFIATFDPFGLGLPVYRVRSMIGGTEGYDYGEGIEKVFVNAACPPEAQPPELSAFVRYIMDGSTSGDEFVEGVDGAVRRAKADAETRREYMKIEMHEAMLKAEARSEGLAEGRTEGLAEGEDRMGRLVKLLVADGRYDDAARAADDEGFRHALFEELGIV